MAIGPLKKITAKQAREICDQFEMAAAAKALLNDQISPDGLLDLLMEHGHLVDAIKLLSFGLPKREAVWWGAQCVRSSLPADAPAKSSEALKAAEAWVYKPTEENRWAAKDTAERAGMDKPAGWPGMGAFWSGGSMVAAHLPQMLPGPAFTANAVSGAILMAAALDDPQRIMELYKLSIEDGIDIAKGGTGKRRPRGDAPAALPSGAPVAKTR
ncbi:MAG TPA: hypothetical protein VE914_06895 [Candidatus Angelobacter sp.]|nr:hypothetical protein [Candidatus Angelobacter sp.]